MKLLVLAVLLVVVGSAGSARAAEWRWPLAGAPGVSRPFSAPAHRYAAGHRGADLPAAPGAAVRAAGDGRVSYAGLVAGRGVVVVVHGDLRTTYEPVSAVVEVGTLVAAGEVVGVLEAGHAGCPVPACLHWGLRRGDDHLDPVRLVRAGPVRLLPLDGPAPNSAEGEPAAAASVRRAEPSSGAASRPVGAEHGPVLAPGEPPAPAMSRRTAAGLVSTAAASLLGAAAVGASRRRRS